MTTPPAAASAGLRLLDRPTLRTPLVDQLRAELAPLLADVEKGARQRELDGELPREQVRRLQDAGFTALRVPLSHGGRGARLPEVTQLWIDLAAADAHLPQALRGHFALVEDRWWHHRQGRDQTAWFARFARGEIAGNAWSETGSTTIETQQTVLRPDGDHGWRLDGRKYYTTGTIFADWIDVYVRRLGRDGTEDAAIAVVDATAPGVEVHDDWDGFGQRGTGSGTTTFTDVRVEEAHVLTFTDRFPYQTALYQLNLLATLVGIGRAALREVVGEVRRRERNYSHANAARVRDDAQVLARVGEVASDVYTAEAVTIRVATALQEVADLAGGPDATERARAANELAEVEASAAQVTVTELVLQATTRLFDALGASATSRGLALDRHWRNARTVSSHNPRVLKARVVGAHLVNGTPPPYAWAIGTTERDEQPGR